jgi:hypothetical protein
VLDIKRHPTKQEREDNLGLLFYLVFLDDLILFKSYYSKGGKVRKVGL